MVSKYQQRPPEELYDVVKDPHCLVNLINDPKLVEKRRELSSQLDAWMKSQGDKGAATEENAHTRQGKARNTRKPQDKGKKKR